MVESPYRKVMAEACAGALISSDLSTQVGAVLLAPTGAKLSVGWNSIPRSLFKEERLERPEKYIYTVHAEARAILSAGRQGFSTIGSTLVCPWSACAACSLTMIEAGVSRNVRLKVAENERWKESIDIGDQMLKEAGVEVIEIEGGFNGYPILHNGELWQP